MIVCLKKGEVRLPLKEKAIKIKNRRFYLIFSVVALLILLLVGSLFYSSLFSSRQTIKVTIPPGSDSADIAHLLAQKKIISCPLLFSLLAKWQGVEGKLMPGSYYFKPGTPYTQILKTLQKGSMFKVHWVTIPEGFTVKQIADRLDSRTHLDGDDFYRLATSQAPALKSEYSFLKSNSTPGLEGCLFPKTYKVDRETTVDKFLRMMLDQFQEETASLRWEVSGKKFNLHQLLTVASLIEKEAKLNKERSLIAAVIYNRLEKGMPLEICATVQYVLPHRKAKLNAQDLKVKSPYNTYLHRGLPPGPICNPGLASIKAALYPAKADYLYYVLVSEKGEHYFTSSYQKFLEAKRRSKSNLKN